MAGSDEKYEGTFEGTKISIFRTVAGHRLEDEELDALFDGKVICIAGTSHKTGREFNAICRLGKNSEGYYRVLMPKWNKGERWTPDVVFSETPPYKMWEHEFTEEERDALKRGERVNGEFTWKSGKKSRCDVEWVVEDGNPMRHLKPIFDN